MRAIRRLDFASAWASYNPTPPHPPLPSPPLPWRDWATLSLVLVLGPVRLPDGEEPSGKVRAGGPRAHDQDARSLGGAEGSRGFLRALPAGATREEAILQYSIIALRTAVVFCILPSFPKGGGRFCVKTMSPSVLKKGCNC